MPWGHVHHIVLDVSDLERSLPFYRDVLGLDPVPAELWPAEGNAPRAVLKTDIGQYVVLAEAEQVKPDGPAQHTNFIVSPREAATRTRPWTGSSRRCRWPSMCPTSSAGIATT